MEISEDQLAGNVTKINLSGRMDIGGVGQIETKLAGMTAAPRTAIIIDMSQVPYMSSIGIRALLTNAKAVGRRGGKLVIFGLQDNVKNVLTMSGIDQIIRILDTQESAAQAVTA